MTPRPPRPLTDEWEWQLHGACRQHDPELFFHSDNERGLARRHREHRAKQVCASCPVLATCRAHALRAEELFGIWGGLSEHERAQLQQGQRAQAG